MPRTQLPILLIGLATAAFILAALSGCKSDSSSTGVPTSITVTGKFMTGSKLPISNSPVVITGRPATVTDANGSFTVTDVTVPYDVTLVVSGSKLAITYRGLSRSDPTLISLNSPGVSANKATVSGTVSGGGGYPEPTTRTSAVSLSSAEVDFYGIPNSTTGAYTSNPAWGGAATITTILRALQWDRNAAGMPTTFIGYGEKTSVTIAAGGTFAGQNIAMTAPSGQTISGTVTVPASLVLTSKTLWLAFPTSGSMLLGSETGTVTAFTYVVPAITGATLLFEAQAAGGGATSSARKTGIAPGTNGIALTLPDPPALSLPVGAATNVSTTTPFSWTPRPSAVYVLVIQGVIGQPYYMVITGVNSGTIPDLTALGLGLPKSSSYSWSVMTFGPIANIDDAAAANGYVPQGDETQTRSSTRSFTTAP